jgi:hypothetical protein
MGDRLSKGEKGNDIQEYTRISRPNKEERIILGRTIRNFIR